jgi:hypothetical protein
MSKIDCPRCGPVDISDTTYLRVTDLLDGSLVEYRKCLGCRAPLPGTVIAVVESDGDEEDIS